MGPRPLRGRPHESNVVFFHRASLERAGNSTTGNVELRAMYGGIQIGFGALALLGALRPAFVSTALVSTVFLCGGLGSLRLVAAIAAREVSSYTAMALGFELGSTILALALLRRAELVSRAAEGPV